MPGLAIIADVLDFRVRTDLLPGRRRRVLSYYLCKDASEGGRGFMYIKCHEVVIEQGSVVEEHYGVSGPIEGSRDGALAIFRRVTRAHNPISSSHIADVVRDEAFSQTNKSMLSVVESSPARMRG